jgi:hypothetical protein
MQLVGGWGGVGGFDMSLSGIILGLISVAIVAAVLMLIGYIIVWFLQWIFQVTVSWDVQRMYIAIVALICLYYIVALLFGLPVPFRLFAEGRL